MAIAWLTEPVSEDAPCGPDLLDADDEPFVSYYFEAESDLPERYFTPGARAANDPIQPGTLFDPKSISHQKERDTILGLLKRSRDLRLLSLMARQQALAQRLDGVADAITGIAALLETFPGDVHPKGGADRRSALEELGATATMLAPLQYMPLAGAAEVSLRRMLVATKQAEPRSGEAGLTESGLMALLQAASAATAVEKTAAQLDEITAALARIKSACMRGDRPFMLAIDPVTDALAAMRQMISSARPELAPAAPAESAEVPEEQPESDEGEATVAAPVRSAGPARQVTNAGEARAALRALEMYFLRHEPSSAALLMVTQARLLVGKPLLEAIETLLPADAPNTRIDFGGDNGFSMPMDRLKMLAKELAALAPADPGPDPDPPELADRSEVGGWLAGIDHYFRTREPASPVPLLIARARACLDKDFGALMAEILPSRGKG
jgi:type VI secretion system protein ImpA